MSYNLRLSKAAANSQCSATFSSARPRQTNQGLGTEDRLKSATGRPTTIDKIEPNVLNLVLKLPKLFLKLSLSTNQLLDQYKRVNGNFKV